MNKIFVEDVQEKRSESRAEPPDEGAATRTSRTARANLLANAQTRWPKQRRNIVNKCKCIPGCQKLKFSMFHWTNDGLEMCLCFFAFFVLDEKKGPCREYTGFFSVLNYETPCVSTSRMQWAGQGGQPQRRWAKGNLRPFRLMCERMNDTCKQFKRVGNNTCEHGTVCVEGSGLRFRKQFCADNCFVSSFNSRLRS